MGVMDGRCHMHSIPSSKDQKRQSLEINSCPHLALASEPTLCTSTPQPNTQIKSQEVESTQMSTN